MTGDQTMDHHVQPRHLYLCDGTCTYSGFNRIHPSLVAFHKCCLFDCASIYEKSSLMTKFQWIIRYLHPFWRSCSLYIVHGNYHIWLMSIMHIHGRCTLMYSGLLHYIIAVTCWYLSFYCIDEWLVFPPWSSLLYLWHGYNLFWPSC